MLTFSDYTKSNFLFPAEKKDCFRIAGLLLQFFEFALNHLQFLLQIFRFGFQEFLSLALRHPLIFLPEPAAHHSAVASSPHPRPPATPAPCLPAGTAQGPIPRPVPGPIPRGPVLSIIGIFLTSFLLIYYEYIPIMYYLSILEKLSGKPERSGFQISLSKLNHFVAENAKIRP